jgi:acyl-CoA synthetase (AMP-forming)/AMP-acid ligase II
VHVFLTKSPLAQAANLSSIRTVVNRAAPIGKSVVDAMCQRLNIDYVINGYGMTELSTIGLIIPVCNKSLQKRGSCGVPLPNSECKVVNVESGKACGPNEHGQLCVRGLQVTKGYLNNPAATNEAIDSEGWLQTGDICYFDNDGFFYIVDRIKEFLKVKGFQVAPAEIEHVILSHPAVADAAVVGILDEYAGELPLAYIVLKADSELTEEEIKKFVAGRLVNYKHLAGGVKFIDAIPKNPSGKILRRVLRDKARQEQKSVGYKSKM